MTKNRTIARQALEITAYKAEIKTCKLDVRNKEKKIYKLQRQIEEITGMNHDLMRQNKQYRDRDSLFEDRAVANRLTITDLTDRIAELEAENEALYNAGQKWTDEDHKCFYRELTEFVKEAAGDMV